MELKTTAQGTGKPVILVHGTSPAIWGDLPDLLAKSHSVITYGRRGHPPNEAAGPAQSIRQHTADLAEICRSQSEKPIIVGWSYGGIIALDLAIQHPDLIDRIIIVEAPLHAKKRPTFAILKGVVGGIILGKKNPAKGARHFLTWVLGRRDGKPSDVALLSDEAIAASGPGIISDLEFGTGEKEVKKQGLAAMTVRCDWLLGTASAPVFASCAKRAAKANPAINLHQVERAGHIIAVDDPAAIVDLAVG